MTISTCIHLIAADSLDKGDIVLKTDFNTSTEQKLWSNSDFTKWQSNSDGTTSLSITVPKEKAKDGNMIHRSIDLNKYRGYKLLLECRVKGENISKPSQPWLGGKFMLHYKSEKEGEFWQNPNNIYGTFDWKTISFSQRIAEDAKDAELYLGLQDCYGTLCFNDIKITVIEKPFPKRPKPMKNPPAVFTGHDGLPRLRGVMSPCEFKEEDIRVLGEEWNGNVIRWQLSRNWGQYNTDRVLKEYDEWIDYKLNEIDKLLPACSKYGVKVVIDLHSPPGGRYTNGESAIFHEKKYQDHFVEIWKKIANRYKGNPAVWGYDLINEPVQKVPPAPGIDDYLGIQKRAALAIRAIDQDIPIFVTGAHSGSAVGYKEMMPIDVTNLIYQVHFYDPMEFTHQGVFSDNFTPVKYPGMISGQMWNKEQIRKMLEPVREFQLAYNVHIYVGEFSAIRWAPGTATYLEDCIDLFEEYGWDWSYHSYREWHGWNVDCGNVITNKQPTIEPSDRKKLLLKWFEKNQQPTKSKLK